MKVTARSPLSQSVLRPWLYTSTGHPPGAVSGRRPPVSGRTGWRTFWSRPSPVLRSAAARWARRRLRHSGPGRMWTPRSGGARPGAGGPPDRPTCSAPAAAWPRDLRGRCTRPGRRPCRRDRPRPRRRRRSWRRLWSWRRQLCCTWNYGVERVTVNVGLTRALERGGRFCPPLMFFVNIFRSIRSIAVIFLIPAQK